MFISFLLGSESTSGGVPETDILYEIGRVYSSLCVCVCVCVCVRVYM